MASMRRRQKRRRFRFRLRDAEAEWFSGSTFVLPSTIFLTSVREINIGVRGPPLPNERANYLEG